MQIGIIAGVPPLATVMQLAGSYAIERYGGQKRLCFWSSVINRFTWFAILGVILVPMTSPSNHVVWIIVGLLGLGSVFNSIGGVAWLSWTKELIPDQSRIAFLSRRNFLTTLLSLALGMAVGAFLDSWNSQHPGSMTGFAGLLGVALAAGIGSSICMSNVADLKRKPIVDGEAPFSHLIRRPLRDSNFRRVVLFYVVWNLSVNLAGPFFCVYMLQKLELPFWQVTALVTLSSVAGLVGNGFWARLKQRFGIKPVIYLTTFADAFVPFLWLFAGGQGMWLLIVIHLFGVFSAPLAIGPQAMVLRLSPNARSSPYMAVFSSIAGPVIAIAAISGGAISGSFVGEWSWGPVAIDGLKIVFLLSFVGRLLSLIILRRIAEPDSRPASDALAHIVRRLSALWAPPETSHEPRRAVFTIRLTGSSGTMQVANAGSSPTNHIKDSSPDVFESM